LYIGQCTHNLLCCPQIRQLNGAAAAVLLLFTMQNKLTKLMGCDIKIPDIVDACILTLNVRYVNQGLCLA